MRGTLSIPTRHRAAIQELVSLPSKSRDELLDRLAGGAPSQADLRAAVDAVTGDKRLFDALMSAAIFRASHGLSAARAATEILTSLSLEEGFDTLAALLQSPQLVLVSKAVDLAGTYAQVLHTSRIVTDVRPIFNDSPDIGLVGSVIVHTLQVSSFTASGFEELFVAMDTEDLTQLRGQIDRAITKAELVRRELQRGSMAALKDGGDDE